MNNIIEKFFALIRYSIHSEQEMPVIYQEDWVNIYSIAEHQAVLGVIFDAIQRDTEKQWNIPRDMLLKWILAKEQIEHQNILLNNRCLELIELLKKDGFQCCILKGQGNALMYPNPYSRMPGDIDVWVRSHRDRRCHTEDVIQYTKKQGEKAEARVYHVEYDWKGVPVELHYLPGIMNNPMYNHRLQQWYNNKADEGFTVAELPDGVGKIPVPTLEFNIVFQLAHMMHHFFDEGIGLRQMIDYYYLLMHNSQCIMHNWEETLKYLNLYDFAGAVMYIMKEVLGLEEKYLIVPVDERRGKTLMKEILKGGNFGRADVRWKKAEGRWHTGKKYFLKGWRNLQFVKEYPAEALCEPVFRTWHYFWRLAH